MIYILTISWFCTTAPVCTETKQIVGPLSKMICQHGMAEAIKYPRDGDKHPTATCVLKPPA